MVGIPEVLVLLLFLVVPLALAVFWIVQFVQLMLLEDDLFPGRHDKIAWMVAFLVLAPLAPFAFLMWKSALTAERKAVRRPAE